MIDILLICVSLYALLLQIALIRKQRAFTAMSQGLRTKMRELMDEHRLALQAKNDKLDAIYKALHGDAR